MCVGCGEGKSWIIRNRKKSISKTREKEFRSNLVQRMNRLCESEEEMQPASHQACSQKMVSIYIYV